MGMISLTLDEGDGGSGDVTTECAFASGGALQGCALSVMPFASVERGSSQPSMTLNGRLKCSIVSSGVSLSQG